MTTVRDVAERAGVSTATVSRVVNANPRVKGHVRSRVERAIADLRYSPDRRARGLRRGGAQVLAVVVPDVRNPFYPSVVRGIEDVAAERGYALTLCNTDDNPLRERRYADINEIEVDDALLRADLVLLGHYHVHTRVRPGVWYAGSPDTFTFADDPGRPKGVVVLDTDTGACRHVALSDQRPLVTLRSVDALGLSPGEVAAQVMARAEAVPEGAVARLYLDGVDPEAYRLLDLAAVQDAAAAALHLKLEPSFVDTAAPVDDLADLASMPARWDGYVEGQDLTGFDHPRIRRLGHEYLVRAVEEAG